MAASLLFFGLLVYGVGVAASQSLMSLGGAVFAMAALVGIIRMRSKNILIWAALTLSLYLMGNLLCRPWDEHSAHTLGWLPLFLVPASAVFLKNSLESRQLKILMMVLTAVYAVSVAWALKQFLFEGQQASSFMRNPIYFAYTLLPAFVFSAEYALNKRPHRCWAIAIAGLTTVGMIASMNRMTALCVAIYLLFRIWPHLRAHNLKLALALPTLLIFAGLASYKLLPQVQEKVDRSLHANDPSVSGRALAWHHNWELFNEHPVFGVGPEKNGIDPAIDKDHQGEWVPGHLYYAHSIYFQILAEAGLVGLILLLAYFAALEHVGGTITRALVIFTLISGISENVFNNSRPFHAMLFYLLLALIIELKPSSTKQHT